MCGICGIVGSQDLSRIKSMVDGLSHRGPDSSGWKIIHGTCALGGACLHITGDQSALFPYHRSGSQHFVLLNGEIYNFKYWQSELQKDGYCFYSDTDTEVVWALYDKFGLEFVDKLEGMFAIAILDGSRMILARDTVGIKPLFFYREGKGLLFSSEAKAIINVMSNKPKLNIRSLQEIITFGYVFSETETLFEKIEQVRPGEIIAFQSNSLSRRLFRQLPKAFSAPFNETDFENEKDRLKKTLFENMEIILNHDGYGKGVFLSGGVDSTLMAVLATEITGKAQTFSLADGSDSPDLMWSRKVAGAIRSTHHEFIVDFKDYLRELPRFVYHYENIVAGGIFDIQGSIAFQLLCQKASQHVRVALTGEGADELFGGYYWIYTHPLGFSDRIKNQLKKALNGAPNAPLASLVNDIFPVPENEQQYCLNVFDILLKSGLSNYHLWSVDRSCGTFGFEIRPFYLSDGIVREALRLPVEYKICLKEKKTKIILKQVARELFNKYGLEDIPFRQKYGMPSALSNVDVQLRRYIDAKISDKHYMTHPFRPFLFSKTEVLMFDIFYYFFFYRNGRFHNIELDEVLEGGIFESMYN